MDREEYADYMDRQDIEKICENCNKFTDRLFNGMCRECYENLNEKCFSGIEDDY